MLPTCTRTEQSSENLVRGFFAEFRGGGSPGPSRGPDVHGHRGREQCQSRSRRLVLRCQRDTAKPIGDALGTLTTRDRYALVMRNLRARRCGRLCGRGRSRWFSWSGPRCRGAGGGVRPGRVPPRRRPRNRCVRRMPGRGCGPGRCHRFSWLSLDGGERGRRWPDSGRRTPLAHASSSDTTQARLPSGANDRQ